MSTTRVRASYAAGEVLTLRAAAHQRQDRLRPRPRRDHHRDGRQAARRRHRLLADDLRADPGGALQLRGHQPAARRGRPGLQHEQHAQHLLTRRGRRPRARRRPAGARSSARTPTGSAASSPRPPGRGPCSTRSPQAGQWGRSMPAGTAQGIALHKEYKGVNACLVEIDCRPETVNRPIRDGVTGPRVTKVVMAVDVGLADQPARPGGPDAGRDHGRHRQHAHLEPAPRRTARSSRAAGTTTSTRASGTSRRSSRCTSCRPTPTSPAAPASSGSPRPVRPSCAPSRGPPARCRRASRSSTPSRWRSPRSPAIPPIPESPTDGLDHTY